MNRESTARQDRIHQLFLRESFSLRRCLKILVRHMEIAVTQVIADRELMFSHLGQHRSNRMAKRMPAHARDADLRKSGLYLPLEYSS